ncbi:MAG: PDZ domain-containing protein [Cyanobacteria bacterium KgW148]|nr:PDZ domain-containing protein [Cyanobacteria bacterium KgW148]
MKFNYTLSVVPEERYFAVEIRIYDWEQAEVSLYMPVWTPGSYLVREFSRLVQGFRAMDGQGVILPWQKVSKNQWRVKAAPVVIVNYLVFANDLTVRTNHVDLTHGYCNGAATFMTIPGYEGEATALKIILPHSDWRVATALVPEQEHCYLVPNYHTLVDSPIEMGIHTRVDFMAAGRPHSFVVWGEGNYEIDRIVADTIKIVETTCQFWGDIPYDRYLFLLHLSTTGNGGLEHQNCCSLNYNPLGFRREGYFRFMNLVAHEFFHTWNVKRLLPKEFWEIDYNRENYTTLLWFAEGITSYYDQLIPLRSGIYDAKHFLKILGDNITRYFHTPGRWEQTLADASFDAWIKLYRPDANSQNTQISYYLKGDLVAMLLDLQLRSQYQSSLDQLLRLAWAECRDRGYTEADIFALVERLSSKNLVRWLDLVLHTVAELDFNYCLHPFGLHLVASDSSAQVPSLGMTVKAVNGRSIVQFVEAKSPAQMAGINPGDELVAIDGFRVENLPDRLRDYDPGQEIKVTLFQRDQLRTYPVVLATPLPDRYNILALRDCTPEQQENLDNWLGHHQTAINI